MKVVRTTARPMLAGVFVVAGLDVLANPEPRAKVAKPVVDMVGSVVPFAPTDPVDAVRLAVSMVPTTVAGHPFWEIDDPVNRSRQRTQFLKNTAVLGGVLVVALD